MLSAESINQTMKNEKSQWPDRLSISGAAAAVASSSQATSQLDSPIVTSALARHPLQEDLYMATR